MKPKKRITRREWLNKPSTGYTSYIFYDIVAEESKVTLGKDQGKLERDVYGILKISDCDRKISLSIELGSAKARKNTFAKLDKLIDELIKFRIELSKTVDEYLTKEDRK